MNWGAQRARHELHAVAYLIGEKLVHQVADIFAAGGGKGPQGASKLQGALVRLVTDARFFSRFAMSPSTWLNSVWPGPIAARRIWLIGVSSHVLFFT